MRVGAAPAAVADGHLQPTEAVLAFGVVIVRPWVAGARAGLRIGVEQRVLIAAELRGERPLAAAKGAFAALPALEAFEVGKHLTIRPAGKARGGEAVVVGAIAAHEGHGVGR
jgi:hypothetical protein